jgi:long-subunit acyl-CoA synthetase (AMP-forming)
MFPNQLEFHLADLAAMTVGATPFSLYVTASPDQIQYVVGDAGAKIAVIDEQFADRFLKVKDDLPDLEHIVVVGDAPEGTLRLEDVEGDPDPDFDAATSAAAGQARRPADAHLHVGDDRARRRASSSRTTTSSSRSRASSSSSTSRRRARSSRGCPTRTSPSATRTTTSRWCSGCRSPSARPAQDRRAAARGEPQLVLRGAAHLGEDQGRAWSPSWAGAPPEQAEQAKQALDAAVKKIRLEQAGEEVPKELADAVAKADEGMFVHLRTALGLNELQACNVGAAPTPPEVLEFFHAIGVPIAELWGMSETCGYGTTNPPQGKIKIGTVGPPAPGCEVKLAEDGELLVKGAFVMRGYRNLDDKTKETLTDDGWLMTGDIAEIDEDGYVKIVDRKKELIINAAGKNMSPANIESELKSAGPLIGQAAVIGDRAVVQHGADRPRRRRRPGLGAEERHRRRVARGARGQRAGPRGGPGEVDKANEKLSRVEQVKKFHIVSGDWEPGGDELTPTMKLKRKPIERSTTRRSRRCTASPRSAGP